MDIRDSNASWRMPESGMSRQRMSGARSAVIEPSTPPEATDSSAHSSAVLAVATSSGGGDLSVAMGEYAAGARRASFHVLARR